MWAREDVSRVVRRTQDHTFNLSTNVADSVWDMRELVDMRIVIAQIHTSPLRHIP